MLFFQLDFLLKFLLPVVLLAAILKRIGLRRILPWGGALASLIFLYAYSALSVEIALFSIAMNYFVARVLLAHRHRGVLAAAIGINLLILGYFKYSVFGSHIVTGATVSWAWTLALPLGVSFYTFQQIAFLVDVYRGTVKSFTLKTYALFKLFFPQFIAGPIVHYERVRASYQRWPTFNARSLRFGLTIIAIGFVKKLIADYFASIADPIFAAQSSLTFYAAWAGMIAFTLQIYFDFSGYSDMAVGLARLFGVSLPFNFNSPYKSRSVGEFWHRWHITLSTWLRDYVYIPLGGNRHGMARMYAALMATMAVGGLWHGAAFHYVAWGVVNGLALMLNRFFRTRLPRAVSVILTLAFTMWAWVLFRSPSLTGALIHYQHLVQPFPAGFGVEFYRAVNVALPFVPLRGSSTHPEQVIQALAFAGALALCLWAPNSQQIALWCAARRVRDFMLAELPVLAAILLLLSLAFISPVTQNAFIYFQF